MDEGNAVGRPKKPTHTATVGGSVVGYLPAGIVIWGGLGKLLDNLLGTEYLTPVGLVFGSVLAMYLVYLYVVRRPEPVPEQQGVSMGPDRSEEEGIT